MNTLKMKAAVYTKYGEPEVIQIQEVNKPSPKDNEILVRIKTTTVTAADSMMRKGSPYIGRIFIGLTKPKYPVAGTGFAGEIVEVGSQVSQFKVGDRVFGESVFGTGTNAEFVCVADDGVVAHIPENMSYEDCASVADGALTSLNLLRDQAKMKKGQKVLIIGASGSLGTAAVQLAKNFGAEVTGVCSSRNAELVKSLGADHVIDYTTADFTQNGQTYDIIYDSVDKSSFSKAKNSLTSEGTYLSPAMSLSIIFQSMKSSIFGGKKAVFAATGLRPANELRILLLELKEMMSQGKLKTVIDRFYPLEKVADAHQYVDTGRKKGNVVITVA